MQNPFEFLTSHTVSDPEATIETEAAVDTSLPSYMERPRLYPSTDLWPPRYPSIKRCLIWRIAVDWGLENCVPRAGRAGRSEYSRFKRCCESYGKLLGNHYDPQQVAIVKEYLDQIVFIPGENIGIGVNLLEFFMFSVRRATNHPEYVYKTRRITLFRRTNRITLRRDEILLLRLVIDSRILVDLVTDPKSTFAVKLKAKCADLHKERFSWLLDPTAVSIDGALDERTPSVLSTSTTSGHGFRLSG